MLVSTEAGGLGNRIKCWVSTRRLDPEARVFWPATPNMPASFAGLFANDCGIERLPEGAETRSSWRLAVLPEDFDYLPDGFAAAGGGAHAVVRRIGRTWWRIRGEPDDRYRYMIAPKQVSSRDNRSDGRLIDFEYGRIPAHFLAVYWPLFAEVAPRPEILDEVETFAAAHFDDRTIGVQVRTWRDAPSRHRKHHLPAVGRLRKLLAAAEADRRFFVVSDDDGVVPWLEGLLGAGRVLAYPRATMRRASWQSAAGMTEDLIDMLLLSRTEELFASYLSTFSETAWWLGGARAKVSVF
ncbi:MAG TPA: hypothetical protein VMR74_02435 [Gammaproteobacteria bacterium]|nr:hypothetical protein [Gammaproteobacteria bacterium]